jgi:transposase
MSPSRDAASLIFNLPEYAVVDAIDLPCGGRRVVIQAMDRDEGCPDCGTVSTRVHAWTRQRVKDIPAGGASVEVVVRKPRWVCAERACGRKTFVQVTDQLPAAAISVDHWHLIRLANLMVTAVRQRVAREWLGRRGRATDGAWAHRMLLLRAADSLSPRAWDRLDRVFTGDDPTGELGAAWGVKERLRLLLACTDLHTADTARGLLGVAVLSANLPETWKLWNTVNDWWDEIETFIETRVTNARTEAANTSIKQIKRTGRGYRNHHHYQARILLASAHRHGRRSPLTQQVTR